MQALFFYLATDQIVLLSDPRLSLKKVLPELLGVGSQRVAFSSVSKKILNIHVIDCMLHNVPLEQWLFSAQRLGTGSPCSRKASMEPPAKRRRYLKGMELAEVDKAFVAHWELDPNEDSQVLLEPEDSPVSDGSQQEGQECEVQEPAGSPEKS